MVSFYKIVLVSILFLVSVSGVCAVDPDNNNDSLTTVEDNNLQLNSSNTILHTSDNVNDLTDDNNRVFNDSSDLSVLGSNCVGNVDKGFIEMVQNRFENKTPYQVSMELYNKSQDNFKNYHQARLKKLTEQIKTNFKTIDNEIDKDLTTRFKRLKVNMNLLKNAAMKSDYNQTKNNSQIVRILNNLLKSTEGSLISIKGYSSLMNHYLDEMDNYYKLKELTKNDTEIDLIIDVNTSQNELQTRLEDLNTLTNTLNLIKNNLNSIIKDLNLITNIIKKT